jgi:hypothetical protein
LIKISQNSTTKRVSHLEVHPNDNMDNNHDIDLIWEDLFEFFTWSFSTYELETYSLTHYPNIAHFLISWELYMRGGKKTSCGIGMRTGNLLED